MSRTFLVGTKFSQHSVHNCRQVVPVSFWCLCKGPLQIKIRQIGVSDSNDMLLTLNPNTYD